AYARFPMRPYLRSIRAAVCRLSYVVVQEDVVPLEGKRGDERVDGAAERDPLPAAVEREARRREVRHLGIVGGDEGLSRERGDERRPFAFVARALVHLPPRPELLVPTTAAPALARHVPDRREGAPPSTRRRRSR